MSSIQNSKKFRERLTAVADQMGISERWALDNYVTDAFVISLVKAIAQQATTYREVVEQTEPLTLSIAETAHVLAAIGMALKLATEHADQTKTNSMAVLTDGTDAIVNIGTAMSADADHIEIGGQTLVWIRGILVAAINLLGDGQWTCPCKGTHGPIRPALWYQDLRATSTSLAAGALQDPPSRKAVLGLAASGLDAAVMHVPDSDLRRYRRGWAY